jgi:MFS family permease
VIGGFVVTYIIRTLPFPSNYGVLFLAATGFVLIGVILFSLVIEPIQPVAKKKKGFGEHLRDGRQIFREDTNYRGLIYVRLLLGVVFMASPFYVVFAKETGGLQESSVGLLLASQMAGLMLSNILWGNIANKSGSRLVLAGTSLFGTIPPLGALIFPIFRTGQWYFVVLFFFLGVCKAGLGLGYSTILLDISPPLKRLTYIGFISTITSPVLFLPILGGTIVDTVSYRPLFIIAALAGGLALHRAMLLKDVKRE